ncbi:MAG: hypothetical protein ACD_44C00012G0003 [uncultured bacterium]|nr:MAG: hypothetical protein ACD_44C00012G0003 [uncultured bacterium]
MPIDFLLPDISHQCCHWAPCAGNSLSLALFKAIKQHNSLLLYVAEDSLAASHLADQLKFFNSDHELWIEVFPDWETLPYDQFSPHPDIISERLSILSRLAFFKKGILIVPLTTLMHRLPSRSFLGSQSFSIKKNESLDLMVLRERLEKEGYRCVNQVYEHGEFSLRGSLFDLFPMGSHIPYRIDLFDNEVDSIRTFDPGSQRSLSCVDAIHILPAHEFPFDEKAIALFRQQWRVVFEGNPLNSLVYQEISQGRTPAGIEYYFPLFFTQTSTLLDYFEEKNIIFYSDKTFSLAEQFWTEVRGRYEQLRYDITRPLLEPKTLFIPPQDLFSQLNQSKQVILLSDNNNKKENFHFSAQALPVLTVNPRLSQAWEALLNYIHQNELRILFCAQTEGRLALFHETLISLNLKIEKIKNWDNFLEKEILLGITVAPFEQGFYLPESKIAIIPESYLLGDPVVRQKRTRGSQIDVDAIICNLSELSLGSPVVHLQHGIGRYLGLKLLTINGVESEFLSLEYAGGDKLYVPVTSLHLINRYSGLEASHAPLHRLGSEQWEKEKRKAKEQIHDVAAELLKIQAKRASSKGFVFQKQNLDYDAFAASFPFEETEDQRKAIAEVLEDMTSERSMDRLVCGDVGFGKTEIAMRAAFLAIQSKKQVAILVPTTLLAQQHYETFQDRFAAWPVTIDVLSRFRTSKQQAETLKKIKSGGVDILIGTHRLLQKDLSFHDLGLIIIDEEHRFGVRQKEKLKNLRNEADILTLTATPIPRTLNLSLSGMRDLSIIATPPARRLSIKTFVPEKNSALIREAILREMYRGGQVYYLHNKVETIELALQELKKCVPEATIGLAHGQMHERELEKIMSDFYHRRFHVLLCTTIIETGIDIPTANTLIIDRADRFGLAQLYQLRGRVGRSHHQAYAYLLVPSLKELLPEAKKRLDAIAAMEDLGAGFSLAMHDLEIRGAGELLGEEQSGNMEAIGFSLYMELLDKAIEDLKQGKVLNLEIENDENPEIDLQIPALLPSDYVQDVNERLILYKRIAYCRSDEGLKALQIELIDRFGSLPQATQYLFEINSLRLIALQLGIKKIEGHSKGGRIEFIKKPRVNVDKIIMKISEVPDKLNFDGPHRLRFSHDTFLPGERIAFLKEMLSCL